MTDQNYEKWGRQIIQQFDLLDVRIKSTPKESDFGGLAYIDGEGNRAVAAPWPTSTLDDLLILAHEVGHILLHMEEKKRGWVWRKLPEHIMEFEAEEFARNWMLSNGLPFYKDMLEDQQDYVADYIYLDGYSGKPISVQAARFAIPDERELKKIVPMFHEIEMEQTSKMQDQQLVKFKRHLALTFICVFFCLFMLMRENIEEAVRQLLFLSGV